MITNPKTFFQQIQNLCEEVALKIKAISASLSSYLTKAAAEATYLDKTEAANTYLGKSETATRATVADSATSANKATQDALGNVITATYATKAELSNKLDTSSAFTKAQADNLYLSKSAKATSASVADTATSATKATQDSEGNIITSTYATKTELNAKQDTATAFKQTDADKLYLAKVGKAVSATSADSASSVPWTGVSGKPQLIPGTGDAGTIKTYETVVAATTVSDSSARSMSLASGGTLTVNNGSGNKAWITVVALAGSATIKLGSSWSWSGPAPALAKGLVTFAWYGTFGVATFTKFGS